MNGEESTCGVTGASALRPLTLDRIEELWEALEHKAPVYLARAVEAAHGIGVAPAEAPSTSVTIETLRQHWLHAMECDHDTGRDKPHCSCSRVDLGWHPSVGAAVEAWLAHVAGQEVGINGMTEAETSATASVMGIVPAKVIIAKHFDPNVVHEWPGPDGVAEVPAPKLAVWFGAMPESNGKANWTAILHSGDISEGFTIERSEHHDRVRYEADRVRHLIGELAEAPDILAYDPDMLSPEGWRHPCGVDSVDGGQQ